ncbi:hypothetical protein GUJ93_ZPchr0009g106 [Zizania palustris]|uniref:Uncharacterized protein n=1 Tax=Zizania palustris TaxID=103762 RepID=A0A8J5V4F9_ZIZPA|nr:hypothetical protein GUJ93_ZPchr0009g106 [Zizania palustris]
MAMTRAVMGLTRVAVLVGAGVAGSVILRNGRLAEILGELQVAAAAATVVLDGWFGSDDPSLAGLQEILDKGHKGKGS